MLIIIICLLTENKFPSLTPTIKILTFHSVVSESYISNGFSACKCREVSLNHNVYDFSIDYNSIYKFDIINIHKYLMIKNKIKKYSASLNKCQLHWNKVLKCLIW